MPPKKVQQAGPPVGGTMKALGDSERPRLVLTGDLGLASSPVFADAIASLCASGAVRISLDLTELEGIDWCGVRAIRAAQALCARHRCDLILRSGDSPLKYVFAPGLAPAPAGGEVERGASSARSGPEVRWTERGER